MRVLGNIIILTTLTLNNNISLIDYLYKFQSTQTLASYI